MRILIAILFLFNLPDLQGRDPELTLENENSFPAIVPSMTDRAPVSFDMTGTCNALVAHFSAVQEKIYHKERFYLKSRFSGRIAPLLKATAMKLSYKYVVVPFPVNPAVHKKNAFFLNSSPFVSVLLNRKSIYSGSYAFHGYHVDQKTSSLHDLGVSIGAGIRVPISSRFLLDVGLRDELGLLNLDGFILGKNSFSQNNSLGVILGLQYKI